MKIEHAVGEPDEFGVLPLTFADYVEETSAEATLKTFLKEEI
jgi:hypothetical protein